MSATRQQRTREQAAWLEVGHTTVRRGAAASLLFCFLAVLYAVPLHQHWAEWREARQTGHPYAASSLDLFRQAPELVTPLREHGPRLYALIHANRLFLAAIHALEDRLEDESILGQHVRPRVQTFFSRWLGVGNEQAYIGRDGWLFYRPDVDSLTGPGFLESAQQARRAAGGDEWRMPPQPDPRPAILDFQRQLAQRGIRLIVVPAPVKPTVHPEQFSRRYDNHHTALQNASYRKWINALKAEGLLVFDPTDLLTQRKVKGAQYLATDTHWRPEAMDIVASALAAYISDTTGISVGESAGNRVPTRLQRRPVQIAAQGDVSHMLDLPADQTLFPAETVILQQVLDEEGQFWRPSPDAEILLLGDSFSNIYSLEPMGWGESAGFVEQLSYHLRAPVDRIVRNDSGAFATRDMLGRELIRGHDRLAGKQVVVWQFAARELALGDWRLIPLEHRDPPPARFMVLTSGETRTVTGMVRAVSPVPRPGTAPYRDHIVAIHLVDTDQGDDAVVYMHSMIDNVWTRAARLRPGEEISVNLRPWADVSERYDGINRSELDDFELQLQEPAWGEW